MNIQDIKAFVSAKEGILIPKLDLSTQMDDNKVPTEWVGYWDNDKRIRIVMHQDLMAKLVADSKLEGLALKREVVNPADTNKASYTRYVVITPNSIVASF